MTSDEMPAPVPSVSIEQQQQQENSVIDSDRDSLSNGCPIGIDDSAESFMDCTATAVVIVVDDPPVVTEEEEQQVVAESSQLG